MSVWFYLLTSLFFFSLILNEFKNTANLKQRSGHCYYRDRRETGPRYDNNTTDTLLNNLVRVARYWPNLLQYIAVDKNSHESEE